MNRETVQLSDIVKPWPRQKQFLEATRTHEYVLFGGAAGPGKSYILRWWLVDLLIKWFRDYGLRGVRVGLFCEDYPSLHDRHIEKLKTEIPEWLGKYRESRREFRLKPQYGGGVIAFRNLDNPGKYQSVEFAAIAVDEITKNKRPTFDVLRSRKRWPGIEFSPFAAATNPGSIGHAWVKKLWIDRDFTGDEDSELNPNSFAFVPATADDNPSLPKSYYTTLASLPPILRQAFKDGDWNIFVGQYFKEWRTGKHTCVPFPIPAHWTTRRVSTDFGYGKPWSSHFYVRNEDLWREKRIHRWYVYRELYGANIRDEEQAEIIAQHLRADLAANPGIQFQCPADPSMWNKKPMQAVSITQVYASKGVPLTKANNDRVPGWQRVRAYLSDQQDGLPAVIYFDTCVAAIRTIPALVHDENNPEDLDTEGEDHAADDLRYFCMNVGPIEIYKQEPMARSPYGWSGAKRKEEDKWPW